MHDTTHALQSSANLLLLLHLAEEISYPALAFRGSRQEGSPFMQFSLFLHGPPGLLIIDRYLPPDVPTSSSR